MDIAFADQHAFLLDERLTVDEIRQRAMDRRAGAFGSGIGSILQRPKADDIELVASQRRLEPFWHVAAQARYVYDRSRDVHDRRQRAPRCATSRSTATTIPSAGRIVHAAHRSSTAARSSPARCTSTV